MICVDFPETICKMNDEFNNNANWTSFTPSFPVRKQMLVILSAAAPGGLSFALRRFLSWTPTFFSFAFHLLNPLRSQATRTSLRLRRLLPILPSRLN